MSTNDYIDVSLLDLKDDEIEPFYKYILEDKSKYKRAVDVINPKTNKPYHDPDGDWLIGESGGFLPNVNFIFKDTHKLREAALFFKKNKKYTLFPEESPEHIKFRKREENRRRNGYTANCKLLHSDIDTYDQLIKSKQFDKAQSLLKPLRITGEQYNFINYGRIFLLDEHKVKEGSLGGDKGESTPLFIDSQYWLTKAKEFAKNNGYHMIVLKSRRKGMSYVEGIDSANEINLKARVTVIHGAYDKKYVTQGNSLSPMSKNQLDFYETHTPFRRNAKGKGLLKKDIEELMVGFRRKDGTADGYLGKILAVSFMNNPDAAIGKDGSKIKLDEMSAFPNFEQVMDVTEPTTRTGSYLTGFIFCGGTGGSKEGSWIQFERNYENPGVFNFLPLENIWDSNSRNRIVGYFMPYWYGLQGIINGKYGLDKDGNSIYKNAIAISKNERELKAKELGSTNHPRYLKFISQYSNRPSEAFSSSTSNLFSSSILTNHIERLKEDKLTTYKDGNIVKIKDKLYFKTLSQLEELSKTYIKFKDLIHPYISNFPLLGDNDPYGCMRMYHAPYRTPDGTIPDDLYGICYDTVGKDLDTPEIKLYHSLNSFHVLTLPNNYGIPEDLICLTYSGRPMKTETVDKFVLNTCRLYNAKAIVEVDRGNTVSNFKSWNSLHWLIKDPSNIIKGKEDPLNVGYGINIGGGGEKAEDGFKYLKEWLYDVKSKREDDSPIYNLERIKDLPILQEAAKYHKQLNVDRLSALRVWMFYRLAFRLKKTREENYNNRTHGTTIAAMGLN